MAFEQLLLTAEQFEEDVKKFGYDTRFLELEFSRGTKNYNNILKRLKTLKLPNPSTFKYSTLTLEEFKEYLSTILNKIFSDAYAKEISHYNSILSLHNISNPFDAALETTLTGDTFSIQKIHISKDLASIELVATAHEYIHGLLSKYNGFQYNSILSNIHYKELLSLLIEYISVYELSELIKGEQLIEKQNIIRLSTDREHIIAGESNRALLSAAKAQKSPLQIPIQKCLNYAEHSDFGYLVSDVYATRLFELYQDDPKTLLTIYKSILDGQKSINDLLNFYGVSLRDNATTMAFYKRMDNVPKI